MCWWCISQPRWQHVCVKFLYKEKTSFYAGLTYTLTYFTHPDGVCLLQALWWWSSVHWWCGLLTGSTRLTLTQPSPSAWWPSLLWAPGHSSRCQLSSSSRQFLHIFRWGSPGSEKELLKMLQSCWQVHQWPTILFSQVDGIQKQQVHQWLTILFCQVDGIQKQLLNVDGVLAVHEFHVWQLAGERIIASAHIRFVRTSTHIWMHHHHPWHCPCLENTPLPTVDGHGRTAPRLPCPYVTVIPVTLYLHHLFIYILFCSLLSHYKRYTRLHSEILLTKPVCIFLFSVDIPRGYTHTHTLSEITHM